MKAHLPLAEDHPSYRAHRRQVATQILLPLILAVLAVIALAVLIGLSTLRDGADPGRWAAISTIWLTLPVMFAGLIFLIILSGFIYLLTRLNKLIPRYSYQAQKFFHRIQSGVKRVADIPVRPILFIEGVAANLRALLSRR